MDSGFLPAVSAPSGRARSKRRADRDGRELRLAWILVVGLGSVWLATWAAPMLKVSGAWPDLVTLFVLWHALYGDPKGRYVPGMLVGLIRDVFSACPFGAYTVIYGIMHRQVAERRYALKRDNPVAQVLLAFVCVFLANCMMHAFLLVTASGIGWTAAISHSAMIAGLSAPFMPLICLGMALGLRALGTARRSGENWAV